jgi:type 1 glutamine amidotransferase
VVEEKVEPIAWTRIADRSKIFYTSLGYPDDFKLPQFRRLLINAIYWALDMNEPK